MTISRHFGLLSIIKTRASMSVADPVGFRRGVHRTIDMFHLVDVLLVICTMWWTVYW